MSTMWRRCCHCCASRDILFRIVDIKTERQVGCISKKWSGVLKEVLTKADRFSVDFPPDIGEASISCNHQTTHNLISLRCWIEGDIVREDVKVRITQSRRGEGGKKGFEFQVSFDVI